MQFKRSKGNFRETDRVVRFKLIKSGKNWLRASTAALGLFRVVRGQVEETIIANVQQDQIESQKHNQAFIFCRNPTSLSRQSVLEYMVILFGES